MHLSDFILKTEFEAEILPGTTQNRNAIYERHTLSMPTFVNIALPIPTPRQFTYAVPDAMRQPQLVGVRALVPFGKRTLTGVIVEANVPGIPQAKEILELLDAEPVFRPSLLKFTHWVAEYYMTSWGDTLRAALPVGMSPESIMRVHTSATITEEELAEMDKKAPRRAELLRELLRHEGDITVGYLEKLLNATSLASQLEALERMGYIERVRTVEADIKPKTQKAISMAADLIDDTETFRQVLDELDASAPKQALLLSHVFIHQTHHPEQPLLMADALRDTHVSSSAVKALVEKGLLQEYETEIFRGETVTEDSLLQRDESNVVYTIEQQHVIDKLNEAIDHGTFKPFLVHGVTGSGKTLIYIEAIRRVLSKGKTALLLVPEIALTPQLIDRFRAFFGKDFAVFHSRMSAGERYDAWRAARNGDVHMVLGTRSAIFAPLDNVGLIIVDEEHESSYKQDAPTPRYNARDCAIVRGSAENAVVLLGSATPSLESMYNARSGKYHLLEITKRADNAQLPSISVIDIIDERKKRRMKGPFSQTLLDAIADRLRKKEGIILFHNRRGFASRLECTECGNIPMCPHCSVALTFHKYFDNLRCHYCGYSTKAPHSCPECGSLELRDVGTGTQRIEDELHEELQKMGLTAEIQRMDLDTTARKGTHRAMLGKFSRGETDILLGTQMVTKGLDFARVTLVGVVNADIQLYLPDFRASERTFQLLTQVSGRAGRSSQFAGEVIIQTTHSRHQAILATITSSYDLFYNDELQQRKDALYPPFTRFCLIEFTGKNEETVHQQAHYFAHFLPSQHKAFIKLGPAIPSIARLRSEHRRIIVLKNLKHIDPSGSLLREALHNAFAAYTQHHPSKAVSIKVDIDSFGIV